MLSGSVVEFPSSEIAVLNKLDDWRDPVREAVPAVKTEKQGVSDDVAATDED